MRPRGRRVGALSALTAVSIMTALTSGMASAVAAPHSSVTQGKKGVHSFAPTKTKAGAKAKAQPVPLPCTGQIYESVGSGATGGTQLYVGAPGAGSVAFSPVGGAYANGYNAIGTDPTTHIMYGIDSTNGHLLAISGAGVALDLGAVAGLPALPGNGFYNVGAFDTGGNLYVAALGQSTLYRIDVTAQTATAIPLSQAIGSADIVFANGYFWGIGGNGSIERINPTTGAVTVFPSVGASGPAGGAFLYGNGDLGFIVNGGAGAAVVYRIGVTNPGSANPTFTVLSTQTAPNSSNIDATSCAAAPADLAITKSVSPASYKPGDQITYNVTVTNNGPNDSSGYTVNDTLPLGLTNISTTTAGCTVSGTSLSCTAGALAAGASRTITVTGTVGPNVSGGLTNTATVRGNDPDLAPGNDTATATALRASVDLQVTKSGPTSAKPGDPVTYTITVKNNGPDASSGWTLTDPIPPGLLNATTSTAGCGIGGGVLTCTGTSLASGASTTITLTGIAGQGFVNIQNTAGVVGNDPDPNLANNTTTSNVAVTQRQVDLAVSKAGPTSAKEGDQVTYTITVTNNGPDASTGWTVTDALPPGLLNATTNTPGCGIGGGALICTGASLASGASTTITLTGTAGQGFTNIQNTVVVQGNDPDPTPGNNKATATVPISVPSADLQVSKAGPTSARVGDQVTYTITVTNNGPDASTGWTVTDTLPPGLLNPKTTTPGCTIVGGVLTCTGGPLANGASTTITLTGTVGQGLGSIQNTVVLRGKEADPNPGNNSSTSTIAVSQRRADLQLTKSGPSSADAGDPVTYTITVKNNGPDDSTGWTVTDQLPARLLSPTTTTPGCTIAGGVLTCTGGPLANGASTTITVTGIADRGFTGIRNTAVVKGLDIDPNSSNNTGSNQAPRPGLRISKSLRAPRIIRPGDTVRYTVTVRNTGDTDYTTANPASFTDDLSGLLDDGKYNDDAVASIGTVSYAEPTLRWTGALKRGETATITYSVKLDSRPFGDLRLVNRIVSDDPASNCTANSRDDECSSSARIDARDKDKDRDHDRNRNRVKKHRVTVADRLRLVKRS
ncbi:DUF11 domain-containing protein [Streptomyces sp. TP-A0356]|uniref:DUF11 domain-containing protein n=1 Tax=Streptomyces sp. TP-A0356 TaxID=1359208 RepID=UPI0006E1A495|nr:DUF11 domain-containing protein [Streptomyces sp. TP-A0356]